MSISCKYVTDDIIPDEGAVSIRVVEDGTSPTVTEMVKHVRDNGELIKATKQKRGLSKSRNAVRMRERRKYPAYRERENERRRLRTKELKKNKKEEEMRKIPPCSILSETSDNIARDTGVAMQDYVVHEKSGNYRGNYIYSRETGRNGEGKREKVIVYCSKSGAIRRAWDIRC